MHSSRYVAGASFAALVLTIAVSAGAAVTRESSKPTSASFAISRHVNHSAGWLSHEARTRKHLVYVADGFSNKVVVYPAGVSNPSPIGEITYGVSEPESMWVDRSGDLFVANTGNNTVEAFRHNGLKPYLIISQSYPGHQWGATSAVVLDRFNNVWVASLDGLVTEYPFGSTTATQTVSAGLSEPIGMTFDTKGYLYVTDINPVFGSRIFKFAPGNPAGVVLPFQFSSTRVGGILFDKLHNTYIADPTNNVIYIFPRGSYSPSSTITDGLAHPVFLAFDGDENLYVQDYYANNVTVYAAGSHNLTTTISTGLGSSYGVAAWNDRY